MTTPIDSRSEFEALCKLLPAEVHWGDAVSPSMVEDIASAARAPLEAEIAELKCAVGDLINSCNARQARMAELSQKLEKAEKDAAMYQWLKENCIQESDQPNALHLVVPHSIKFGAATWSKDIDTALSQQSSVEVES